MGACTAIVPVRRQTPAGVATLRRAMREAAMTTAVALPAPRFTLEPLEPRRMMSAGAAGAPLFDSHGVAKALLPPDLEKYAWASPTDVERADDGKLLVVGNVYDRSMADPATWVVARFNVDGSPDGSFGADGTGIETVPVGHVGYDERVLPLAGGKFILCGWTNDGVVVGRFNADGSVDRAFGGGLRTYSAVWPGGGAAWLTADGQVEILGNLNPWLIPDMSDYDEAIATLRLNADGTPDESLGQGGRAIGAFTISMDTESFYKDLDFYYNGEIVAAQPMADGGSLLYLEWFPLQTPRPDVGAALARVELDPAGHVRSRHIIYPDIPSATLVPGTQEQQGGSYYGVEMAADGSVFISPGVSDGRVEKLDPAGHPDPSFGVGGVLTTPASDVQVVAVGADGKPLLLEWPWPDDSATPDLTEFVRLNADGSTDPTFAPLAGSDGYDARLLLPDGTLVLATGDWIPADPAGFEVFTIFSDGRRSVPDPSGDSATSAAAASDPAVFGTLGASAAAGGGMSGLFAAASDATVWNPQGTRDVYA